MELQEQFSHITTLISKAKENAFHAVNKELVTLYWHVGEYVSQQVEKKTWGKSVVNDLSLFIQRSEPNIVGFSPQNIWRMKQFVETYKDFPKLATLSRVFPKDKIILNTEEITMSKKSKTIVERLSYYRYENGFITIQALENMRPRWGQNQKHDSFSINI
ncbi:DUF1016 domain-containing protein [Flavobacterium sp. ZT3R18]|uniref:DUF1016 N-terminal domain-containing protein n=1 Tax=Flavobacterium sp. ZT3R18 TaxID=2594429 RepID=UPI00117A09CE|nr:DUF1016 N-terminal domain-containing protein [Flavobacterium sp. ZT3R18]TRX37312.1 DUF1016 domain-containing protein [Flavobacterium sp. ZT3R18]